MTKLAVRLLVSRIGLQKLNDILADICFDYLIDCDDPEEYQFYYRLSEAYDTLNERFFRLYSLRRKTS